MAWFRYPERMQKPPPNAGEYHTKQSTCQYSSSRNIEEIVALPRNRIQFNYGSGADFRPFVARSPHRPQFPRSVRLQRFDQRHTLIQAVSIEADDRSGIFPGRRGTKHDLG